MGARLSSNEGQFLIEVIELCFSPFYFDFHNHEGSVAAARIEVDLLPWCSLPDILYAGVERRFVGLSFPVDVGSEHVAQNFADLQNSELVRCFGSEESERLSRYAGFGTAARLELMWSQEVEAALHCEFASLFSGVWRLIEASSEAARTPEGFILLNVQQLLIAHHLTMP